MATKKTEAKAEKSEAKLCACGCKLEVNPKSTFRPGHDAKLKSALLAAWDDGQGAVAEELVTRGWYTWEQLQERQAKRDEKAAKKALKAKEGDTSRGTAPSDTEEVA